MIEGESKREERTRQSRVPESDRPDLAAENALARAVLFNRLGEMRARSFVLMTPGAQSQYEPA